jgi:4-deoxy-L-threo-5-hexosulose-uronate ketol-isomerase
MYRNTYYATHPKAVNGASTAELRDMYLMRDLFTGGELRLNYVHQERMIIGSASPLDRALALPVDESGGPFLARRELGLINIGAGAGLVRVDGVAHEVGPLDALYVGMGAREVVFESPAADKPPRFYLASTPAHAASPTRGLLRSLIKPLRRGEAATANQRLIYQYIVPGSCASAQLLMGLTLMKSGNVWNTMPPHTHERRSEVYFYFNLPPDTPVFHFMGRQDETRHIVVRNEEAVICPPWSLHMGVGTAAYAFIWAMGGDNLDYDDMHGVALDGLS